ncbi:MAG TPA: CHASE4 domain-containing protein [Kiritimatiellia bacterium]|mgnify:CR=1 FL=1|nr:CHASE4 domain-containing protein [Kiritimatiellia bacterium]HMP34816.1 CHASE4 domain-containing protein [Kiritimatiellia bacterium]
MMNRTVKKIGFVTTLFALFLGLSLLIQRWIIYPQFQRLQNLFIEDAVQRLRLALDREQRDLEALCGDYAMWDETIAFLEAPDPEFVDRNIPVDGSVRGLFDLLWILDASGRFVYRSVHDPEQGEQRELTVNTDEREQLGDGHPLLQPLMSRDVRGYYRLDGRVFRIAASPVVRSDGSGDPRGVVVMGRELDAAHMEALSGLVSMRVSLHEPSAAPPLASVERFVQRLRSSGAVESWILLLDIYGDVGAALLMDAPREITVVGRRALTQGVVAMVAQGVLFLAIGLAVMVRNQRKSQQAEIARQLDERTATLRETELYLKTIMDSVPVGILIVDTSRHTILDVNPAALWLIGSRREEVVGRICHTVMRIGQDNGLRALGQDERSEGQVLRSNGSTVPVLKTVVPILLRNRPSLLICFVDITEQKAAEEKVNQSIQDLSRFNRSMIGREERILDLKREVNGLLRELGRTIRYREHEDGPREERT